MEKLEDAICPFIDECPTIKISYGNKVPSYEAVVEIRASFCDFKNHINCLKYKSFIKDLIAVTV